MTKAVPKTLRGKLGRLGACSEARKWGNGQDPRKAWYACTEPDWLLWLCAYLLPRRYLRLALAAILRAQALPNAGTAADVVQRVIDLLERGAEPEEYHAAAAAADDAAYAAKDYNQARSAQCDIIRGAVPWRAVRAAAVRRGLLETKRRNP